MTTDAEMYRSIEKIRIELKIIRRRVIALTVPVVLGLLLLLVIAVGVWWR